MTRSPHWESIAVDKWLTPETDIDPEPLGGKEKFWILGPDGHEYLFKYARSDSDGSNVRGEDWAEWSVCELANLIGVPTAVVVPATCDGQRGILSRSVWRTREQLTHGNELLAQTNPDYDSSALRQNPAYTVDAVYVALSGVKGPAGCDSTIANGFDAWAGYVLLDAWVAGRDRHHENWAVVNNAGALTLAPSYDHGNALGFQESEARATWLSTDPAALTRWVQRGNSFHFAGKPSLVTVAAEALRLAGPDARHHWLRRLGEVTPHQVSRILAEIPEPMMSDSGRRFRMKLLGLNQERILNAFR